MFLSFLHNHFVVLARSANVALRPPSAVESWPADALGCATGRLPKVNVLRAPHSGAARPSSVSRVVARSLPIAHMTEEEERRFLSKPA